MRALAGRGRDGLTRCAARARGEHVCESVCDTWLYEVPGQLSTASMKDNHVPASTTHGLPAETLRDLAGNARFAELLDPQQFAAYATEMLPSCREQGHAVRTVLAPSDVHWLTDSANRSSTRLAVAQLDDDLPFVVISLQSEVRRYRWVVPMWQPGAQEWLADSTRQKRALIAIDAADGSVSAALYVGGIFDDTALLAGLTRVRAAVPEKMRIASLLAAGHLGARLQLGPVHATAGSKGKWRVMVAARDKAAHEVMSAWTSLALSLDDQAPPHELLLH